MDAYEFRRFTEQWNDYVNMTTEILQPGYTYSHWLYIGILDAIKVNAYIYQAP